MALDVRGTVVAAPRERNLERALRHVGIESELAAEIDQSVPEEVLRRFRSETRILNWTLVTVLEAASLIRQTGRDFSSAAIDRTVAYIESEYLDASTSLVDDSVLFTFVDALNTLHIGTLFAPDGPSWREHALIRRLFPLSLKASRGMYAGDQAGCNKLSPDFYRHLAGSVGTTTSRTLVVGDRLDKDISVGVEAGCKCVYIGPPPDEIPVANYHSFEKFAEAIVSEIERQ